MSETNYTLSSYDPIEIEVTHVDAPDEFIDKMVEITLNDYNAPSEPSEEWLSENLEVGSYDELWWQVHDEFQEYFNEDSDQMIEEEILDVLVGRLEQTFTDEEIQDALEKLNLDDEEIIEAYSLEAVTDSEEELKQELETAKIYYTHDVLRMNAALDAYIDHEGLVLLDETEAINLLGISDENKGAALLDTAKLCGGYGSIIKAASRQLAMESLIFTSDITVEVLKDDAAMEYLLGTDEFVDFED